MTCLKFDTDIQPQLELSLFFLPGKSFIKMYALCQIGPRLETRYS